MVRIKLRPFLLCTLAALLQWMTLTSSPAKDIRLAYGHWKTDADETVRLNPFVSQAVLILLAKDVMENQGARGREAIPIKAVVLCGAVRRAFAISHHEQTTSL